jgi:hypothetical protein
MQIQRQTTDFGAFRQQRERAATARTNTFDAILSRESAVTRQDLGAVGAGRQNFATTAPSTPPLSRGDDRSGASRLSGLNPNLITPFPVPSTPPTLPPASTPPATVPPATVPPASVQAPRTPAPSTAAPPSAPAPQVTAERHPAMAALRSALTAMGMPFAGVDMEYNEQVVGYPGGSYINRLITVRGAGGRVENFDADLTLKNPQIAAVDLANFMRGNV